MKLFIVYTTHKDYDEHDPFIVLAESKIQARELVLMNDKFLEDKLARRRESGQEPWGDGHFGGWCKPEDKPSDITNIEEVPLGEGKVVWAVSNLG